jgi:hypothetical protein
LGTDARDNLEVIWKIVEKSEESTAECEDAYYADIIRALIEEVEWEDGSFVIVSNPRNGDYVEDYAVDQCADYVGCVPRLGDAAPLQRRI